MHAHAVHRTSEDRECVVPARAYGQEQVSVTKQRIIVRSREATGIGHNVFAVQCGHDGAAKGSDRAKLHRPPAKRTEMTLNHIEGGVVTDPQRRPE